MNRNLKLSIVVPLYNEAANITPLYVRLTLVMAKIEEPYKIVFVERRQYGPHTKDALRNL